MNLNTTDYVVIEHESKLLTAIEHPFYTPPMPPLGLLRASLPPAGCIRSSSFRGNQSKRTTPESRCSSLFSPGLGWKEWITRPTPGTFSVTSNPASSGSLSSYRCSHHQPREEVNSTETSRQLLLSPILPLGSSLTCHFPANLGY